MSKLQNKYAFSFLGSIIVIFFSLFSTKLLINLGDNSILHSSNQSFGELVAMFYIFPIVFVVGLIIYFFVSKKIFKSFREAFFRVIDLFVWLIVIVVVMYAYISVRSRSSL